MQHPEFDIDGKSESIDEDDPAPISRDKRKRCAEEVRIFDVRSKKDRAEMFVQTIPDWVAASTMMDCNSPRAQKLHKYV